MKTCYFIILILNNICIMKVPLMKKKGRPLGSSKGKTKQSVTVMLRIEDIELAGGMDKAREKIINNFSKL